MLLCNFNSDGLVFIPLYSKITAMSEDSSEPQLARYTSQPARYDLPLFLPKPSNDEYSKNKICQLHEEVARLRREAAQRECIWNKEKNQLLSKAEILNLENVEIKQRLAQLLKVNQTMEIALGAKENTEERTARKDDAQIREVQQQLAQKNKSIKELRKVADELKKKLSIMEDEKNRTIQSKDQKITALTAANKQMAMDHEDRLATIKRQLAAMPFNREIIAAIMRIFHGASQNELTYQDLQDSQFSESPVTKRYNESKDWSRNLRPKDSSFSRISSHSIINQLNAHPLQSQFSQGEEEGEKLLCEVCRKVFGERDFIDHMEDCKKLRLQRERQQLQRDIRDLNEEHRKSLSQLKRKNNENVLRDLTTNANNTPGKLQKKGSKVIKEPQERPGNFSQLIGNDYRSSKYF